MKMAGKKGVVEEQWKSFGKGIFLAILPSEGCTVSDGAAAAPMLAALSLALPPPPPVGAVCMDVQIRFS